MGSLVTKIVFMPPRKHVSNDSDNDKLLETPHRTKIQVKQIIKNMNYLYLIISHGNAENVESVYNWASNVLSNYMNVNIVMYEYSGYGIGQEGIVPTEQYVYDDITTVYNYLVIEKNIPPERIIAYGRSVGSGPSCYLAEKFPLGGLIINCGLMSVYRVIFKFRFTLPGDLFPNIDRMKHIKCPVCVIHSIKDEIIPFYHGKELYKAARNKFDPLFLDGTNHNNIDKLSDDVFKHMEKFFKYIDHEYREVNIDNNNNLNIE